ncbi:hypothetical protein BGZ65_012251, partial [Modicella reniformis]
MESHFEGTIFRIPLRTLDTQQHNSQGNIGQIWTLTQVQDRLRSWIEDAKVGMLFLKKMETIELRDNVRDSASFNWTATKSVGIGGPEANMALDHHAESKQHGTSVVEIKIATSNSQNTETLQWLVHTEQSSLEDTPKSVKDHAQKNRWNVDRGIAIPLNFNYKSGQFHGRLFTHLPTPIRTGLPFHIHGDFALTSNRTGLARGSDQEDPKCIWNHYLMQEAMPVTVANAFEKLAKRMFPAEAQGPKATEIEQYFKLWPIITETDGVHAQIIKAFIERFIQTSYNHPIFPCKFAHKTPQVSVHAGKDVFFTWLNLKNAPGNINRAICGQLQLKDHNTCDCSDELQTQIERFWKSSSNALSFSQIDPDL